MLNTLVRWNHQICTVSTKRASCDLIKRPLWNDVFASRFSAQTINAQGHTNWMRFDHWSKHEKQRSEYPIFRQFIVLIVKLEILLKDCLSKSPKDLRPACQLGVRLSGYLSKLLLALGNDARKQHWHAVDVVHGSTDNISLWKMKLVSLAHSSNAWRDSEKQAKPYDVRTFRKHEDVF